MVLRGELIQKKCACWHFGEHNIQTVGISISTDNDFISKKSNVYKLKYKREKKYKPFQSYPR